MHPEFQPDLSALAGDYQILTALRSADHSKTYLARHLKLNRDVTITVTKPAVGEDASVEGLLEDAKVLSVARHRSVIPVIEGRRLPDGSFAIIRARVRGQTLEQLVANVGAMPVARVASTLEQVHSAIDWARQNRIANRNVSADAIVFQQGSGRVLLELEPAAKPGAANDACDDARTIGRLAYEMLSGHREGDAGAKPLAVVRPDLPERIVKETESLMQCDTNRGSRDAIALITLLSGKSESIGAPFAKTSKREVAIPAGPLDSAVVVVKRPFGYAARLATAVAVIAIIGTLGVVLLNRRGNDNLPRTTAGEVAQTKSDAGGDVVPPVPTQRDTFYSPPSTGTIVSSSPVAVVAPPSSTPRPAIVDSTTRGQTRPLPPETRRREPRVEAPSRLPDPTPPIVRDTARRVVNPPDTVVLPTVPLAPPKSADGCDSPEPSDQQRCLSSAVERNDRELNSAYQQLIGALRRQAGVQPTDPDPSSVDELRESQRHWLESRDAACRDAGAAPLYARARSECYAGQSSRRASELLERLRQIP